MSMNPAQCIRSDLQAWQQNFLDKAFYKWSRKVFRKQERFGTNRTYPKGILYHPLNLKRV